MRILHFCNYADQVGGAEVYAHSLVKALRTRGHEVGLFGASPKSEINEPELRVIQRPSYAQDRLVLDPGAHAAFDEYLVRFRPDVIHAHNLFSVGLELVERLGTCGVPLIHTVHDFQLICPNSWCVRGDGTPCPGGAGEQCFRYGCQDNYPYDSWEVLLSAIRQQFSSSGVDIALAPSSYLVERLRANGWRDVRRLPYFIDFQPSPEIGRDEHQLLYAGRMEKEKGVHILLDAMPEILAAHPRVRLSLLGSGSQKGPLLKLAARHGLLKSVSFLDALPRAELSTYYARSALCVIPSIWTENSPLVAYECLLSGLPMVGSRIGGIPEMIEPDCGLTFAPGQRQELALQVIRFLELSSTDRGRISVAARARARSFDKEGHLDDMESIYAEARSRGKSKTSPSGLRDLLPILAKMPVTSRRTHWIRGIAKALRLPKVLTDQKRP